MEYEDPKYDASLREIFQWHAKIWCTRVEFFKRIFAGEMNGPEAWNDLASEHRQKIVTELIDEAQAQVYGWTLRIYQEDTKNMSLKHPTDTPYAWGFWCDDPTYGKKLIALPKVPMLLAGLGPPPFDVTLPHTNEVRHIIELEDDGNGGWRERNLSGENSPGEVQGSESGAPSISATV